MRVLIVGSHGQLGRELVHLGVKHELLAVDHEHLDITDVNAVDNIVAEFKPDVMINAAAYTAVDRAESERELAFSVNCEGPMNLAVAAENAGLPLIHVSTDYVFDGTKQDAYIEEDLSSPLGVYGESKLAGEHAVAQYCARHVILRTSWVFSAHGNNFVKTMLRLGGERESLAIVADQYGCPTAANELARAIYAMLDADWNSIWGTYHFCQPEPTTWCDFAKAVFSEFRGQGGQLKVTDVKAIATTDYPTPAKRPQNSVMNYNKFEQSFGFSIRPWSESLAEVIKDLNHV